ncbi:MAG: hypothetical protein KF781_06320 [Chitinophagaceae bacterium]|nr:hypothetical protein [Chitinophagaceae bacterium]MCW5904163.1 hypothetical protein [Chitinophagaceae bacterium]
MLHSNFEGDTKKFTLTAFVSFAVVFVFLVLFSCCHGDYRTEKSGEHHNAPAVDNAH